MGQRHTIGIIILLGILSISFLLGNDQEHNNWPEYLGGPDRNHYSTLTLINTQNVKELVKAWEYHTGDSGQIQCNPIIIDGVMYGMTAATIPFAIDAATGNEIWRKQDSSKFPWYSTSRGVVYWRDPIDPKQQRILYTNEAFLYALDAKTGSVIHGFGDSGRVSLKAGLGPTAKDKFVISNTPGTVFEDLIVMPLRLSEGTDAAVGFIQAFNIRTGKLAWVFKTIPSPGEPGYETWSANNYKNTDVGGANNWAGMAVDRKRGILFVPTGSAAFDFFGGNRKGNNLYANCLLALDARTGKRIWHFQAVHHDILDRDFPSPPNLLTLERDGKKVDVVAQISKQGFVYVFERETGKPFFDIKEQPVPASELADEWSPKTQPIPVKPVPYARQLLKDSNDISPYASNRKELIEKLKKVRSEGPFTPLSSRGTIIYPGLDGGGEWGGAAVDPEGVMYVNSNEMAWLISLSKQEPEKKSGDGGSRLYTQYCVVCHGENRKGNAASGYPDLTDVAKKFQRAQVQTLISKGKGMMPAFKQLNANQQKAIVAYLYGDKSVVVAKEPGQNASAMKYKISGYTKFLDKDGYPAVAPPWGTLNAIDLNTGEYLWKIPYGEYPELMARGIPATGAESYGGPAVTAGGLLFIAGTKDEKFRAYDKKTGQLLWETKLPAAAFATPSVYEVNGRQYVVVACGGTKLGAKKGESYVAFALPR